MRYIAALFLFLLGVTAAHAQATVETCTRSTPTGFCNANSSTNPLPVASSNLPAGATAVSASSGNVAAASATATLGAVAGKTTYISAFTITGAGATAGSVVTCTIGTLVGGSIWSIDVAIPTGPTVGVTPITMALHNPIPANGQNVSISVVCPSFGAGNTNAAVTAFGYQQ